jgi:hypothetical protein
MALFRYFSPEGALRVLETGELMVTPPKYLNDPFECRPVIKCEDPRGFARRQIDKITTPEFFERHRSVLPVRTFKKFKSVLRRRTAELQERLIATARETDSHTQNVVQDVVSEAWGVICFAADDLDQRMWAHYASSHQGLVIEFQQSHLFFSGPSFFQIQYSDERVVFDPTSPTAREDAKLFLSRKRLQWSSERESRLLVELAVATARDVGDGFRYFIPIEPEIMVSVTLGLRANDQTRRRVIELLRAPQFAHVKVFEIRLKIETGTFEREPL